MLVAARVPFIILMLIATEVSAQAILSTVCTPPLPAKTTRCQTVIDTTKLKNGPVCVRATDAAGNTSQQCFIVQNPPLPTVPSDVRITESR